MHDIDQRDRELLNALQEKVPLASTPFAIIGQMIEMSEKEVIKRTERMRRDGVIRQVAGQFDPRALGYRSALVAARIPEERLEEGAATISAHPGVTQNYRRNHDLNIWFTVAVAPGSRLGLERTIEVLGTAAGCEVVRPLPTRKLYKTSSPDGTESFGEPEVATVDLTPLQVECVRLLQRDLPLQPRPFDALSRLTGIAADDIISGGHSLMASGAMRRFGAIAASRKAGFVASAMGVWVVPENRADEIGTKFSQNRAVSHCYLRPVYPDWPYNIFTTVHGRSVDECESIINDLAIDTGLEEKQALFPMREFKKTRINFFAPEAEQWEESHADARAAAAS